MLLGTLWSFAISAAFINVQTYLLTYMRKPGIVIDSVLCDLESVFKVDKCSSRSIRRKFTINCVVYSITHQSPSFGSSSRDRTLLNNMKRRAVSLLRLRCLSVWHLDCRSVSRRRRRWRWQLRWATITRHTSVARWTVSLRAVITSEPAPS